MCIIAELFCDCIVGVVGLEHLLVDGSGVFTKGNENVHCQSSKKDVICASGNEDFGKQALDGGKEKDFLSAVQAVAISGTFLEVVWQMPGWKVSFPGPHRSDQVKGL